MGVKLLSSTSSSSRKTRIAHKINSKRLLRYIFLFLLAGAFFSKVYHYSYNNREVTTSAIILKGREEREQHQRQREDDLGVKDKQRIDFLEEEEAKTRTTTTTTVRLENELHDTAKNILRAVDVRLADQLYPSSSVTHNSWWLPTSSRALWKSDEEYAVRWKNFRNGFQEENDNNNNNNNNRIGIVHCFNNDDNKRSSIVQYIVVDLCETYESKKDDDAYFAAVYKQFQFWNVNKILVIVDSPLSSSSSSLDINNCAMKLKDKSSEGGEIAIEVSYMKESHDALFARMRRARGVALAGYAVSPVSFLAGVSRYDGRFITPYLGMSAMQGGESTRKDPRVMTSAANWKRAVMFTHRVHWRQHYPLLDEDDFVVPEENNRISAVQPKDESMRACEDLWGWRGLQNRWEMNRNDMQTMYVTASRSNRHPTAQGFIRMEAKLNAVPLHNVAIDVSPHRDAMSRNPWHRLTALYATFVAKSRFFPNRDATSVSLLLPCQNPEDIPSEYAVFGKPRCRRSSDTVQFDSVVKIANDGLLWDLAWDGSLPCRDESLFKSFVKLLAGGGEIFATPKVPFTDRSICFMRRLNTSVRRLTNEAAVLQMLRDTFPTNDVQLLNIQAGDGVEKTRASVQKCGVFLGVHGAGMINEIYTLKDSVIFEMVPDNRPAYYRNCAVLRGLFYTNLLISGTTTDTKSVTVNVATLQQKMQSIIIR